jgi:hypothetical protein
MIPALALLGLLLAPLQARQPTVGDTLWAVRVVRVPTGHSVRAAPWELTGDVEVLGRAQIAMSGGLTRIRYPLVVWKPGSHTVSIPGALLLAADGSVDSLPALDTTFVVASVLPASVPDTALHPQPQAGIVHRRTVSWLPLAILLAAAILILLPLHWLWRRRGPRAEPPAAARIPVAPLARWAEAGESRTVLAAAAEQLRSAADSARRRGAGDAALPAGEVDTTLRALDDARFAGATPKHAAELFARAASLTTILGGQETVP